MTNNQKSDRKYIQGIMSDYFAKTIIRMEKREKKKDEQHS